jgi:hypothetical protein
MWKLPNSLRTDYRYAYDVNIKSWDKEDYQQDRFKRTDYANLAYEAEWWCEDNCRHGWSHTHRGFSFDNKSEALLFKLTWAGLA